MQLFRIIAGLLGKMPASDAAVVARQRLLFGAALGVAAFALIGLQIFTLASGEITRNGWTTARDSGTPRGRILDRQGRILAVSLPAYEIHADPEKIMDPAADAKTLAALLPGKTEAEIGKQLTRKGRYAELAWKASPATYGRVLEAGIAGVYGRKRITRFYPQTFQAAHVLGQVDKDRNGIAGIEAGFNDRLKSGEDVVLAIDLEVQAILRREIKTQIDRFEAIGGAGVIMDIETGEIIALASLPDYDPNAPPEPGSDALFNRATRGVYELGSVFKVLNTAMALDSGAFRATDIIDVVSPLYVGRFQIRDFHPENTPLNVAEVMIVSSNIGSARIAAGLGAKAQKRYIRALGLTERIDLGIPESAMPLVPSHWKRTEVMTISYGHGISVTPVHLVTAIATATGDGHKPIPSLLKGGAAHAISEEVFRPETTRQVRAIMRRVVSHKRGTGEFANAGGYLVGGKSGTAEKHAVGGYNKKANIASFIGVFPLHAPRYAVLVMVDEPRPQTFSHNYATGGWVSAPAVRRIITHAAPLLGVLPVDETSPEIKRRLAIRLPVLDGGIKNASF